ncbi:hypothetical protein [Paenibacillus ferrarius]|uniref:hypothetical protein n=1 Tax=Paenibacillus ferrarius TaxID=1469647 RepID=UPI001FC93AB6|nr:hypothetical protein [Paenibacillus ferrarius]
MNAVKPANYAKVKAQELQKKLYLAAKENPKRRFHALYDKIYREDILWEAWIRVGHKSSNNALVVTVNETLLPVLPPVLARVRHLQMAA